MIASTHLRVGGWLEHLLGRNWQLSRNQMKECSRSYPNSETGCGPDQTPRGSEQQLGQHQRSQKMPGHLPHERERKRKVLPRFWRGAGNISVPTAIVAGSRNFALFLIALPASTTDPLLIFLGCYQVPMYLTVMVMRPIYARAAQPQN